MDGDDSQPVAAGLEASLALRLEVAGDRIARVAIDGSRPVQAARVLEGRPAESALATLEVLFRLCRTAQSVAGLRAVEKAFDCGPGPAGRAARSLVVEFEVLEQALWRVLLDWPRCIGERPDTEAFKGFRERLAALQRGVVGGAQWNRLGGGSVSCDTAALTAGVDSFTEEVDARLFGGARRDDVFASLSSFRNWVRERRSPTAAGFDWIASNDLEAFGGTGILPMDDFDTQYISDRIARDDAWEYCSLPDHHGEVPQTGALARLATTPLVRELHAEHGCGLTTQLAARLMEVASLLGGIRDQLPALVPEEAPAARVIGTGAALGAVETARGRLFHWVDVHDGRIARYRTLAPTEWNFHPRGPLARGLAGAPAGDLAITRRAVDLLVTAIDPCVGFRLEFAEA